MYKGNTGPFFAAWTSASLSLTRKSRLNQTICIMYLVRLRKRIWKISLESMQTSRKQSALVEQRLQGVLVALDYAGRVWLQVDLV